MLFSGLYIVVKALFKLLDGRKVGHRTERVYIRADWVDNIVNALLNNYRIRSADRGNFALETVFTAQTVAFVCKTAVLAQNTRTIEV